MSFDAFQLWRWIETAMCSLPKFLFFQLLTHSNYEDGLKPHTWEAHRDERLSFDAFQLWRWIETRSLDGSWPTAEIFWRIPIMKMDWNILNGTANTGIRKTFDAFQLWRWIETRFKVWYKNLKDTFDAFQLWRWIETHGAVSGASAHLVFWRIPIMKMDWNLRATSLK